MHSLLVPVVLFGWIPAILLAFAILPSRQAVVAVFVAGWLFLPATGYKVTFLPDYDKTNATCLGVFCATLIFDTQRFLAFRPRWFDIPVVVLSFTPFLSSLSNGLGAYDGVSAAFGSSVGWLLPYLLGRIYFNDVSRMRDLMIGIFIGGLIYMPLCLWEIRMSPQLNNIVYGFRIGGWHEVARGGGWRPSVFMAHGLMLAMYMTVASLAGIWLWWSKSLRTLFGAPIYVFVLPLLVTTVLCKSTGALMLLAFGMGALAAIRWFRTSAPLVAISLACILYVALRATGAWDAANTIEWAERIAGESRAASWETRVTHDTRLAEHARTRFLLGWGGWGRNRIFDDEGRDTSITDTMWVIRFGVNGAVGLAAMLATILMPSMLLRFRVHPRLWNHPAIAPTALAALIPCLWMVDNLSNSMPNPIYILIIGGLSGMAPAALAAARPQAAPASTAPRVTPSQRVRERRLAAKRVPRKEPDVT